MNELIFAPAELRLLLSTIHDILYAILAVPRQPATAIKHRLCDVRKTHNRSRTHPSNVRLNTLSNDLGKPRVFLRDHG